MAIATIPESTAHLYQIRLYVDRFATDMGKEKYELDKNIGFNLILDGVDDTMKDLLGATAGTNYGENNSLVAISRNDSGPALIGAGVIAILLGFVGKLAGLVQTVPLAVGGGRLIALPKQNGTIILIVPFLYSKSPSSIYLHGHSQEIDI